MLAVILKMLNCPNMTNDFNRTSVSKLVDFSITYSDCENMINMNYPKLIKDSIAKLICIIWCTIFSKDFVDYACKTCQFNKQTHVPEFV